MTCEQCEENLLPYLDHELSPEEAAEVEHHISRCSHCQSELTEMRRFSLNIHNATIPFRQAVEVVETGVRHAGHQEAGERSPRKVLRWGNSSRLFWGGIASACVILAVFLVFRPRDSRFDQLAAWGVQHYPLVDQVHTIHGDADGVRLWFREHHNIEVTPPHNVNYADLVGCKMIDLDSEPTPLLRFDGQQTAAVFILPAKSIRSATLNNTIGLNKEGFHIELWREESTAYLKVSRVL